MTRPALEARSAEFARSVFTLCSAIRGMPGGGHPSNQLQRAASAVAANYRASSRARSADEFIAKIGLVSEEADEACFWLEFVAGTHLVDASSVTPLQLESRELRAIFASSYATARRNRKARVPKRR